MATVEQQATEADKYEWTDFSLIQYPPKFAAEALGISPQTLKRIEEEYDLQIGRTPRGSVETRAYTINDLFHIARLRREARQTMGFNRPVTGAVYVSKGGTSKTTTTCNMAIQFALTGLKVLMIDNDQQGDLTSMLGYDPDLTPEELEELGAPRDIAVDGHFGNVLAMGSRFEKKTLDSVIKKPFGEYGPHLIPAEDSMDNMDTVLRSQPGSDFLYGYFFEKSREGKYAHCDLSSYDVILIDNAPATSAMSRNAMIAADFLICPIRMDKFSYKAMSRLADSLTDFAERFKRAPEIIAVPTMYVAHRPRMQKNLAKLVGLFPGKVTHEQLHSSEDYSKSLDDGVPLSLWRQGGEKSAGAVRKVFAEVCERIRNVTEQ